MSVFMREPDATRIIPGLYQGSRPPPGPYQVDVLVLMAEEYQPSSKNFPGVFVVHAPISDDPEGVTVAERHAILETAQIVARALRNGKTALVTCNMGWNRSGIVSALALRMLRPKLSPDDVIQLVRAARGPQALSNPNFERIVRGETPKHRTS